MIGMDVAAEAVSASTALAGLLLVYLGAITVSYGSYAPSERKTVRHSHLRRAWAAFVGIVVCLVAAVAGLVAKWVPSEGMGDLAVVLLGVGFAFAGWSAYMTVREIG